MWGGWENSGLEVKMPGQRSQSNCSMHRTKSQGKGQAKDGY